ncbi:MAG: metallophosphoesterase [Ignavibacteria bacterium]|nr:metallophosphoesterase [Ignavibacteria bacterium]
MKIFPLSDLHIEFENPDIKIPDVDVIILAGDIGIGNKGVKWIKDHIKKVPVIYVLGNHEYYGNKYPGLLNKLKDETRDTNITLLENEIFELNDVLFFGATLWTDYEIFGQSRISGHECEQLMTDFKKIRIEPRYSKIKHTDLIHIHKKSLRWLIESLTKNKNNINIVITHHAPSLKSIPEIYNKDLETAAYASNLENIIQDCKPHFWIHGHIHSSSDYTIDDCRIICNPFGYPDERNKEFKENLIIEV